MDSDHAAPRVSHHAAPRVRFRSALRRDWVPVLLLVGLVAVGTWGLVAMNATTITGRWPDAADVIRYSYFFAGMTLAALVADAVSRVDRAYALAGAISPWRLPCAVGLRLVAFAVVGLTLALVAVAWQVTRVPAGGSPWWWLVPSALGWLLACWGIGVWIGGLFESRPRTAAVAGFFAAFVGVLLSLFADAVPTPRLAVNWDSTEVLNHEWGGGFVASRVDAGVALWGIATAVVFALTVAVLAGRSAGSWTRVLAPLAALAVMGLLAPLLGVGGGALERRHATADELTCTHEHVGARLCGWPEDAALIGTIDAQWDRIVDRQQTVGLPVPGGSIFINSSRPEGSAGTDVDSAFTTVQSIATQLATVSASQLAAQCPDSSDYWGRADLVAEWLGKQSLAGPDGLDGEVGYRIEWTTPEEAAEFDAALAASPEEAQAWARDIIDGIRACEPAGQR